MSASSHVRRKAKKIGIPGDDPGEDVEEVTFVRRPQPKNKRVTSAKVSFGVDSLGADDDSESTVVKPKKPGLGRPILGTSARRQGGFASIADSDSLARGEDERPSYSKEYLAELRSSNPWAPKPEEGPLPEGGELEVTGLSGSSITKYEATGPSIVPTDAEIQEKKARRARLAKEQKYRNGSGTDSDEGNSLNEARDSDEDEFRTQREKISLNDARSAKPSKYGESRLVQDDEDFMEDFDNFVDAGQISMGRKAERLQKAQQREQMRELIDDAEGGPESEDSSDSDADAREQYEATQARRAMEGKKGNRPRHRGSETQVPPKITPLPSLSSCKERLRATLQNAETELASNTKRLEQVEIERREIEEREKDIQRLLNETADRYKQLVASGVLRSDHIDSKLLGNGASTTTT